MAARDARSVRLRAFTFAKIMSRTLAGATDTGDSGKRDVADLFRIGSGKKKWAKKTQEIVIRIYRRELKGTKGVSATCVARPR